MADSPLQPWPFVDTPGDIVRMDEFGTVTPPPAVQIGNYPAQVDQCFIIDLAANKGRIRGYRNGWVHESPGAAINPAAPGSTDLATGLWYYTGVDQGSLRSNIGTIVAFRLSVPASLAWTTNPAITGGPTLIGNQMVMQMPGSITVSLGAQNGVAVTSATVELVQAGGSVVPGYSGNPMAIAASEALDQKLFFIRVTANGLSYDIPTIFEVRNAALVLAASATPPTVVGTKGAQPTRLDVASLYVGVIDGLTLTGAPAWITTETPSTIVFNWNQVTDPGNPAAVPFSFNPFNSSGPGPEMTATADADPAVSLALLSPPVLPVNTGTGTVSSPFRLLSAGRYTIDAAQGLTLAYQLMKRVTSPVGAWAVVSGQTDPVAGYVFARPADEGFDFTWRETPGDPTANAGLAQLAANAASVAPVAGTVTITEGFATATFSNVQQWRKIGRQVHVQYANTSGALVSASPQSQQLVRQTSSGTVLNGGTATWAFGMQWKAGNAAQHRGISPTATIAQRQAVWHGVTGVYQGIDQDVGRDPNGNPNTVAVQYQHSMNVHPSATGTPFTGTNGVLTFGESRVNNAAVDMRPAVMSFVEYVIYGPSDTFPSADPLDIPAAADDVTPLAMRSDIMAGSALPNVAPVGGFVPPAAASIVNLLHPQLHLAAAGTSERNMRPFMIYPGDEFGVGRTMVGLCTSAYSNAEKDAILPLLCAFELRVAVRVRQGLVQLGAGGNAGINLEAMAFVCHVLGRPAWLVNVIRQRVEGTIPPGNYGQLALNPGPTTGKSVYAANHMAYMVTQAMVTTPRYTSYPHIQIEVGSADWADSGTPDYHEGPPTTDVGVNKPLGGKAAYSHIDAQCRSYGRLALAMIGALDLLGPLGDPSQRRIDGYMQRRIENGKQLPDGVANDVELNTVPGLLPMWTAYSGAAGRFTLPSYVGALAVHSRDGGVINFTDFVQPRAGTWVGAIKLQRDTGSGLADIEAWDFPADVTASKTSTANRVWFSGRTAMLKPTVAIVAGGSYAWVIAAGTIESRTAPGIFHPGGTFTFTG